MPEFQQLLHRNRSWVEARLEEDPEFFKKLVQGQSPLFLIFGCSDSRKCLNSMIGTGPGELFIHRNIANLVPLEDGNVQAVLEFAILTLRVRHVVVGGHTHCGGVGAALDGVEGGAVGAWLRPLRELAERHSDELAALPDHEARSDHLAEINVIAQVENILRSPAYARAKEGESPPGIHGWMFDLGSGYIREMELPWEDWRERGFL
jgi:carbonic anhydrase